MRDTESMQNESRELTARATHVVQRLALLPLLGNHGQPEHIGSSSFGLMVKPDIDFGTLCPRLDPAGILESFLPLASADGVKEIHWHDERGRFNQTGQPEDEGIYVGLRYVDGERIEALTWKIDLWFFPNDAPRPEITVRDRILDASDAERETILRIKHAAVENGSYGNSVRGIDIYTAVLDQGVNSLQDWQTLHPDPDNT